MILDKSSDLGSQLFQMSGSHDIDSILDEVLATTGRIIISEELPLRRAKLERLASIPRMVPPEESSLIEEVPTMVTVVYDSGSMSYINLKAVPVIQRTIDDTYHLMWPDTSDRILLKTLFSFSRESDPVAYQRIESYLASKSK